MDERDLSNRGAALNYAEGCTIGDGNMPGNDLETLLIRSQFLAPTEVALAKRDAAGRHRRLAPMLVELGLVDERRFAEWMSQMTSIPIVDPIPAAAVEPLVRRIPRAIAREYEVLPLKIDPGTLTIATMNPLDGAAIEVLHLTTALNIRSMIGLHSAIIELLARFYPEDATEGTLMPAPFDPSETMAIHSPDASPGSTTRAISPRPPSQLDRIEQSIEELRAMMTRLQERLDSVEESLEFILSRK